jgi:hypothetical protein
LLEQPINQMRLDAQSELIIDALGRLVQFDSAMRLEPFREVLSVHGVVEGDKLQLQLRSGGTSFTREMKLPSQALLSDALSPQTQLPGLRLGQAWTVPVYSPLWLAKAPMEIIYAKVEGKESILWDDAVQETWLVVYRDEPESGAMAGRAPRGKGWVRRDGTVLKQEMLFVDVAVTFVRLPDEETEQLVKKIGPQWWDQNFDGRKTYD